MFYCIFYRPADEETMNTHRLTEVCRIQDISVFVPMLQQLRTALNEARGAAETFAFPGASLLTVEKLRSLCLSTFYDNCSPHALNGGYNGVWDTCFERLLATHGLHTAKNQKSIHINHAGRARLSRDATKTKWPPH